MRPSELLANVSCDGEALDALDRFSEGTLLAGGSLGYSGFAVAGGATVALCDTSQAAESMIR